MEVIKYVEKMVENAAQAREINVGEEVWNIMYNLLAEFNVRANSQLDRNNEALMGTLSAYEANYFNHYPKTGEWKPMEV